MSDLSVFASVMGLAPGAVGGVCSVFIGHPIDLIKVRMQVGGARIMNSTFGMLQGIFIQEGLPGLYRGVTAPLLAVTPAFAVSFYSFEMAKQGLLEYNHANYVNHHSPSSSELSIAQVSLAGGASGIPLAAIFGPTERIKCLMQASEKGTYTGFVDCFRHVYKEGGVKSVVKGTASTALRDVPGNAAYFGTYELMKRWSCQLEGTTKASTVGTLMAGGIAGIVNWIIAIPFDVVKSRWQTAPSGTYSSVLDVFQTLIRTEGPGALFRGISPALLRAFPANAACLYGVETVKDLLEKHR